MDSDALIELALKKLGCTQQELAKRLGVSPTQVSKWKGDGTEHMSLEMEKKVKAVAGLDEDADAGFIRLAGGVKDAAKWERLIRHLADLAYEGDETGYITVPLQEDEAPFLPGRTLQVLGELGAKIPQPFPKKWDFDYERATELELEALWADPFCHLISISFKTLTDLYGFYAAFLSDLISDSALEENWGENGQIESCLLDLAVCKSEFDRSLTPKFEEFKRKTLKEYREWLMDLKEQAIRARIPLKAELLHLVDRSAGHSGHEAEAESLGFNDDRLHPDIYINELLVSVRLMHQVLPALLKKLDIDFAVDESELRNGPEEQRRDSPRPAPAPSE
jgi:transcriptional regulator with XRE-family HTH domain